MSLGNLQATPIIRTKAKHGEYIETPDEPVEGCSLQPIKSSERIVDGEITTTRWEFIAPPGFPLESKNLVEIGGMRLHVEGELTLTTDRLGRPRYISGVLTKWKG